MTLLVSPLGSYHGAELGRHTGAGLSVMRMRRRSSGSDLLPRPQILPGRWMALIFSVNRLSNRTFHCGTWQDICVDNTCVDITCRPGRACLTLLLCAVYILLSESAGCRQTLVGRRRLRSGWCHACTFLADGVNSVNI